MPLDQTNWKPETETKPDAFSLEGLIAWLETQPPETKYDYCDSGACLLHQYFTANGVPVFCVSATNWYTDGADHYRLHILPKKFNDVSVGRPRTFGAALSRARALLAETRK